ncbi:hypothetical protein H2198_006748 [Neophaeococcomyces mojaviensis]|uniref:Uncharacterized protein n=1 Tax=Neophaeococcomyces mojaviensis TaxID=3383035 RepID=A0ACC3A232_9EURO|nr:hypothetical protein H2198_006748 [Knufia sp. JES_112]
MSQPLLTVIGATGVQGRSVIDEALRNQKYRIRAVTRNVESSGAQELAKTGVEVVEADLNDLSSLRSALQGTELLFASSNFFEPFMTRDASTAAEIEATQGINLAKAAAETASLEHFVWSTLPSSSKISKGKYAVPHFEGKHKVDTYIKTQDILLAKTTFLFVTWYAQNFTYPMFTPSIVVSI